MKYTPGIYQLLLFSDVGSKIETKPSELQSLYGAEAEGEAALREGRAASYVVTRVLLNSANKEKERWQ